ATIAAMERCGADRARVAVALGPTIRQPNYEVGPEFVARFKAEDGANERFFRPSATPHTALFDLPRYIPHPLPAAPVRRVHPPAPLASAGSSTTATPPLPLQPGFPAIAAAPTATSPTTGATSTPSRSHISGDFANQRAPFPIPGKGWGRESHGWLRLPASDQ